MSLVLTPEVLCAAYDLLELTEPFCRWNLPSSDQVAFKVLPLKGKCAECVPWGPDYAIHMSSCCVGHLNTLLMTTAHEMVHIYMYRVGINEKNHHGPGFRKLAGQVCKVHGFDPKLF